MLKLEIDQRSGTRMELVFVTYNEEQRISYLIDYYGSDYDFVIMDGGSTDRTMEIVASRGGSVYSRIGEAIGESHFAYYVNNLSKSGRCFTLQCDEFVDRKDLALADSILSDPNGYVLGRRIDWFYNKRARRLTCVAPKGFPSGKAVFNPDNIHDTLSYDGKPSQQITIDVDHLHIMSMKDDYGKIGRYTFYEVEQLSVSPHPFRASVMRFLRLVRAMQLNIFRFPTNLSLVGLLFAQFFALLSLAIMAAFEQNALPTVSEQREAYRRHFTRHTREARGTSRGDPE